MLKLMMLGLVGLVLALSTVAPAAMATDARGSNEERGSHDGRGSTADHGSQQESAATTSADVKLGTVAAGVGVLHAIDKEKRMVNLTHEPMPDLSWPEMTMDLPVTRRVDLSTVKAGDLIDFKIKLGRDKKYRVIEMKTR